MTEVRVTEVITESALGGYSNALVPVVLNEPLLDGFSHVRAAVAMNEPLVGGYSHVRAALYIVESLLPIPPEEIMVDAILPGFGNSLADHTIPEAADPGSGATPGLAFTVHMKPMFNTRVSTAVNFNSIRTPLADFPQWQFDCPYEFLKGDTGASSSIENLLGFFCARMGRQYPFLMKNPDFYLAADQTIGTADGTRLQWDFLRAIGTEYTEPVGQVDITNTVNVYLTIAEAHSVPGSGPYTITTTHAAAFVVDGGVTHLGVPLVKVGSSPATGQYSVVAGVYTFNSAQSGQAMVITYRYLVDPADYTVTMPNKLVFDVAPAADAIITWSGQFWFTCYFMEDAADFEKFAKQLWQLQTLTFHSELLA